MAINRVLIDRPPFADGANGWQPGGVWPAKWITHPDLHAASDPVVLWFELKAPGGKCRLHLSADQRYDLFVSDFTADRIVGVGPERGDEHHWRFESYDVDLAAGDVLRVRVWWLSNRAPLAQHSVRPALLVAAENAEDADAWNTGKAGWRVQSRPLPMRYDRVTFGCPAYLDGVGAADVWSGGEEAWQEAVVIPPAIGQTVAGVGGQAINAADDRNTGSPWRLVPAMLPAQQGGRWERARVVHADAHADEPVNPDLHDADRAAQWQSMVEGKALRTDRRERVLLDLGDYVCARPRIELRGNGTLTMRWSESLYEAPAGEEVGWWPNLPKGDRAKIAGKRFSGVGDTFKADGGSHAVQTPDFRAGRYVQIETGPGEGDMEVRFAFDESRYPHAFESTFALADEPGPLLKAVEPLCRRTLEMCSHETYMDTPYYERLQYIGDTRIQCLLTYALTRDDRLPKQAMRAFDHSRMTNGLTRSRYPSSEDQTIPPFSLWWVAMVHDYARWRDDAAFVREQLNGVRSVMNAWLDGVPPGWMFCDWVHGWEHGVPPGSAEGEGPIFAAQQALVARQAAELERQFGQTPYADYFQQAAEHLGEQAAAEFDADRGLIPVGGMATEHAQILALLSPETAAALPAGAADAMWAKLCDPDATWDATASVYFSHYLFDLCRQQRDLSPMRRRLSLWQAMLDNGCKTAVESPEPTRSDCHAWSAHPLLHAYTTCLGVQPGEFGFTRVRVAPLMDGKCEMVHPRGTIRVSVAGEAVDVTVPDGVTFDIDR